MNSGTTTKPKALCGEQISHVSHVISQKCAVPFHATVIWHQIQAARTDGRDIHVVFLGLANAVGSVRSISISKEFKACTVLSSLIYQLPYNISIGKLFGT